MVYLRDRVRDMRGQKGTKQKRGSHLWIMRDTLVPSCPLVCPLEKLSYNAIIRDFRDRGTRYRGQGQNYPRTYPRG